MNQQVEMELPATLVVSDWSFGGVHDAPARIVAT